MLLNQHACRLSLHVVNIPLLNLLSYSIYELAQLALHNIYFVKF